MLLCHMVREDGYYKYIWSHRWQGMYVLLMKTRKTEMYLPKTTTGRDFYSMFFLVSRLRM